MRGPIDNNMKSHQIHVKINSKGNPNHRIHHENSTAKHTLEITGTSMQQNKKFHHIHVKKRET